MTAEASEDIGIVTTVVANKITVEIPKGGGCKSCSMHGICGTNSKPIILTFASDGTYKPGDKVIVSVSTGIKLLSTVIVYLLPLMALFAGFLIARSFMQELGAVLIGFISLALSFLVVRWLDRKIGKHINFQLGGKCEDLS